MEGGVDRRTGLTVSISVKLAYRGHCLPPLSNNMTPLPSRFIVTYAMPQPNKPATNPTPTTPLPFHFGAEEPRSGGGSLLAVLLLLVVVVAVLLLLLA